MPYFTNHGRDLLTMQNFCQKCLETGSLVGPGTIVRIENTKKYVYLEKGVPVPNNFPHLYVPYSIKEVRAKDKVRLCSIVI